VCAKLYQGIIKTIEYNAFRFQILPLLALLILSCENEKELATKITQVVPMQSLSVRMMASARRQAGRTVAWQGGV